MPHTPPPKHSNPQRQLPSARGIRRACSKELYRTRKKLKTYISPDLVEQGDHLYVRKVAENLLWIHEHHSNRKLLCDWWDENVCSELAALWKVDEAELAAAFRSSFGG
ncbi:dehydrogenase [Paenibacillus sp. JX-17]|uniref:Dehydrogenase n=1 Tax=Paenibacillus lacisoli TaxID=3064525 RepID=A0ABT9CEZ3_9BACL|nr:dehydrogenase [Paenibacillus sp. JX-17]MDO7907822.1 dehydrogenase [Paenibacillus sp. JX-17]